MNSKVLTSSTKESIIKGNIQDDITKAIDKEINDTILMENNNKTLVVIQYWFRRLCPNHGNTYQGIWKIIIMYKQWDLVESVMHHLLIRQKVLISKEVLYESFTNGLYPKSIFNLDNITQICQQTVNILKEEPNVLEVPLIDNQQFYIIGTLKGQFRDLLYWLNLIDFENKPIKPIILFLGNYVDYHDQEIELVLYLFCLKIKYPNNIFLLRSKHDFSEINQMYGFYDRCAHRLISENPISDGRTMYSEINKAFMQLSYCALVNDAVFCVSAGIPPEFIEDDWIQKMNERVLDSNDDIINAICFQELCWSDTDQIQQNMIERMIQFCKVHKIKTIVRGKEFYDAGYKYLVKGESDNDCQVITLHSNLFYTRTRENDAAIMEVTWNANDDEYDYVIKVLKYNEVIAKCAEHSEKNRIYSIPPYIQTHDIRNPVKSGSSLKSKGIIE